MGLLHCRIGPRRTVKGCWLSGCCCKQRYSIQSTTSVLFHLYTHSLTNTTPYITISLYTNQPNTTPANYNNSQSAHRQISHRQSSPHLHLPLPTPTTALGQVHGSHPQCSPHGHCRCATSPPAVAVAHLQALPPGQGTAQPQLWLQALIPPRTPPPGSAIVISSVGLVLIYIISNPLFFFCFFCQMTVEFCFRVTRGNARGYFPRHVCIKWKKIILCRFVLL